jgi:hypothetical protein
MVNPNKVKEKLPNLLVGGCTSNPANWQMLLKKDYRLQKYQERKPESFNTDLNDLVNVLERFDRNTEQAFAEFKFMRRR